MDVFLWDGDHLAALADTDVALGLGELLADSRPEDVLDQLHPGCLAFQIGMLLLVLGLALVHPGTESPTRTVHGDQLRVLLETEDQVVVDRVQAHEALAELADDLLTFLDLLGEQVDVHLFDGTHGLGKLYQELGNRIFCDHSSSF